MTYSASICSVTLIVPMLDVMYDPTFPAIIIDINVGANSRITDCLVAKPIKDFDKKGLLKFRAVLIETTPPIKNDKITTMGIESIIKSLISLKISFLRTLNLLGLTNDNFIIIKYLPMSSIKNIISSLSYKYCINS